MKTILLDCDDVLLDWLTGFAAYCSQKLEREICNRGPNDWVMDEWLGTEPHETLQLIQEFNASPHFGRLQPVAGAVTAIHRAIANRGGGLRFHVITSCSSDVATIEMRRQNLETYFGHGIFDSIHCLDLGQSKASVLHAFNAPCLWVEDNLKNAKLGVQAGHRVFMRETSHNRRHREEALAHGITWFSHWDDLKLEEQF